MWTLPQMPSTSWLTLLQPTKFLFWMFFLSICLFVFGILILFGVGAGSYVSFNSYLKKKVAFVIKNIIFVLLKIFYNQKYYFCSYFRYFFSYLKIFLSPSLKILFLLSVCSPSPLKSIILLFKAWLKKKIPPSIAHSLVNELSY